DLLLSRPFLEIAQRRLGRAESRLLPLHVGRQLRIVEAHEKLPARDLVPFLDEPLENASGDLHAHVHLGRLDGARDGHGRRDSTVQVTSGPRSGYGKGGDDEEGENAAGPPKPHRAHRQAATGEAPGSRVPTVRPW